MSNFFKAVSNMKRPIKKIQDYKLYYKLDTGEPLFYSMDDADGDFIIVDKTTYSEARYDVYVENKILIKKVFKDISKLTQHGDATTCAVGDISIVSSNGVNWSLRSYDN
jgi:hypothetical protein